MARIRTIKPEFWQDEKMAPLPPIDRLVFLGLVSQADDAGRLVDNIRLLDGLIFPCTDDTCAGSIETLARLGRVRRYESDSGQRLIQITTWDRHQRVVNPSKYTLPAPPPEGGAPQQDTEPYLEPNESLNRTAQDPKSPTVDPLPTTNDQRPAPARPSKEEAWTDLFESEFWTRYPPRKGNRGKKEALSAWRARMREGVDPSQIMDAVRRYHRYCEVSEKLATPYVMKASTFLNDPDNFANPWTPPTADEKPRPPRPEPPSPDSEAARVRDELPRQDGHRSGPLTLVGKDTTPESEKRKRIDEWKRENSEELDALRSDAIDEMGLALQAVARKPEVARGMVEARVDKLIWERIGEAA